MREQTSGPFYVGLDIGTQTVRCVVGMPDQNDPSKMSIVGHGSAHNMGMRKGVIVHPEDVAEAVIQAVTEAERLSGHHITAATVNINGAHVTGMNSRGVIAVSTMDRQIGPEERMRVEEAATIVQLPANREIIQVFAKNYRLDGQDNIKDPIGMHGVRLEVDTHIVTAVTPNVRTLDAVLEKAQVAPAHRTISGLAAAEAVLSRQQKEAGTLLMDIGAGTTNLVVIEDGEVQHVSVIPVGGMHITNDLAIGLKTDLDIAEAVKLEHAALGKEAGAKSAHVKHNNKTHSFPLEDVYMITEARVEELFELVDKELRRIHRSRKLPGGIVLVGGTAKLPGLADFAKEKLQLAARVGQLQPLTGVLDTVNEPAYFPAVGLMLLDMLLMPGPGSPVAGQPNTSVFNLVDDLWQRLRRRNNKH
jgi:cell division protein FtsA